MIAPAAAAAATTSGISGSVSSPVFGVEVFAAVPVPDVVLFVEPPGVVAAPAGSHFAYSVRLSFTS